MSTENLNWDDIGEFRYNYIVNRMLFHTFGDAVNYCVKKNISLKQIELISRSEKIEQICGRRKGGIPIQFPFELDYHCPICGKEPVKVDSNNELELLHLHFSEYNYFMWCERCNIDIPSLLCLKAHSKYAVSIYTDRFLQMVSSIQEKAIRDYLATKQEEAEGKVNCKYYHFNPANNYQWCDLNKENEQMNCNECKEKKARRTNKKNG